MNQKTSSFSLTEPQLPPDWVVRTTASDGTRAICVHLLHVAMTTDPFITDHLFVPLGITVKQLSALPFQVVQ